MIRFLTLGAVALSLALYAGCAAPVTVDIPPAESRELSGDRTLTVGAITGPQADTVARALKDALAGQPGIVLTGPDEARYDLNGRVRIRIDDMEGRDLVKTERKTGKRITRTVRDPFVNRTFKIDEPDVEAAPELYPYVQRDARLELEWFLKDRKGSTVLGPETVTVEISRKYGGFNELIPGRPKIADRPEQDETAREMARRAAAELAEAVQPMATRFTFYLDRGKGGFGEPEIRRGVDLAIGGDWDQAARIWRAIIKLDPEHPAALYNLGVSYERLGGPENLEKAFDLYAKAAREGNNPLYREALTRTALAIHKLKSPNIE